MNILDEILAYKLTEVAQAKAQYSAASLKQSPYFENPTYSLKSALRNKGSSGVIAEIKRKSPSKGFFKNDISVVEISTGYAKAGAAGISVLTDNKYFAGQNEDLKIARRVNTSPILRKDFIVDEYQIIEAKAIGADVVLLIAAALPYEKLKKFARIAKSIGLETLLEVHTREEIENYICDDIDIVGVNNRDLQSFVTGVERSVKLAEFIPNGFLKISESAIDSPATVNQLREYGFNGFLIGEAFMKAPDPVQACAEFIRSL